MNKIQQGDVILRRSPELPENTVPRGSVVAEGEATGHAHRLKGNAEVVTAQAVTFVCVYEPSELTHEEHSTIALPVGTYEVGRVQEYDHFAEEARQVED